MFTAVLLTSLMVAQDNLPPDKKVTGEVSRIDVSLGRKDGYMLLSFRGREEEKPDIAHLTLFANAKDADVTFDGKKVMFAQLLGKIGEAETDGKRINVTAWSRLNRYGAATKADFTTTLAKPKPAQAEPKPKPESMMRIRVRYYAPHDDPTPSGLREFYLYVPKSYAYPELVQFSAGEAGRGHVLRAGLAVRQGDSKSDLYFLFEPKTAYWPKPEEVP